MTKSKDETQLHYLSSVLDSLRNGALLDVKEVVEKALLIETNQIRNEKRIQAYEKEKKDMRTVEQREETIWIVHRYNSDSGWIAHPTHVSNLDSVLPIFAGEEVVLCREIIGGKGVNDDLATDS